MSWLVTGGAGYIGSHVVDALKSSGEKIVILDNLSTGRAERLPKECEFIHGDIRDLSKVQEILLVKRISGVINLAALKSVEESYLNPIEYDSVNHLGVRNILEAAKNVGVKFFLQTSTAAVYGQTHSGFVNENSELKPISPYGQSKLSAEIALEEFSKGGFGFATSLRFFNVIGTKNNLLRDSSIENIIPKVINSIKINQPPKIYGDDYPTKDGTCIRDYVHVSDVAEAHVNVINKIGSAGFPKAINIGTGIGYSVKQIISAILLEYSSDLIPEVTARRPGDPSMLVANVDLARNVLGFEATRNLTDMIQSVVIEGPQSHG